MNKIDKIKEFIVWENCVHYSKNKECDSLFLTTIRIKRDDKEKQYNVSGIEEHLDDHFSFENKLDKKESLVLCNIDDYCKIYLNLLNLSKYKLEEE